MHTKGALLQLVLFGAILLIGGVLLVTPLLQKTGKIGGIGGGLVGVGTCQATGMKFIEYDYWLASFFKEHKDRAINLLKDDPDKEKAIDFCVESLSCFGGKKKVHKQMSKSPNIACCFKNFENEMMEILGGGGYKDLEKIYGKYFRKRCKYVQE